MPSFLSKRSSTRNHQDRLSHSGRHALASVVAGLVVAILLLGESGLSAQSTSADFYVSVEGNDAWSGTLPEVNADGSDGPFATLVRARDALRDVSSNATRDYRVLIRDGVYRLSETAVFSLEDSAPEGHTITYAAYPGEKAVFSSGRPVDGWRKLTDASVSLPTASRGNVWVADVSDFGKFHTLFNGTAQLPRARSAGFNQTNVTPRGSQDYHEVEFPRGAVADCADLDDVELRIIPSHFWIMNLLPIASIDVLNSTLTTTAPGTYPLGKNAMTERPTAWIENALEVLDEPGEWVLDSGQGRLYLWPLGDRPGSGIVAPMLTELIRVEGRIDYDGPTDTPVEGLVFQGLTFMHGDRYPWQGRTGWGVQHDWECFDKPTALVRFRGAERCGVEDCVFTASGHTAVRFDLHCQENRVVGCHIHHVGGVAVLLAGYGPGTKDVNRRNEVANNCIHHIGLEYWASVAIFAWQSGENRIAHNHIAYLPYTAILSTGRVLRTTPGPAECSRTIRWDEVPEEFAKLDWYGREPFLHSRGNIIEYNDIHNVMERLGDGNCIYVSGTGTGNIVRNNFCHDCTGHHMNAVIRCDDDQHGTLMEGNVIARTRGNAEGFISKGGNDIINNFIVDLRPRAKHRAYITFPYGDIQGSTIERNILYSRGPNQTLYYHNQPSGRHGEPPRLRDTATDENLYYSTEDPAWADEHLKQQREVGNERNSIVADPMFADIDADDYSFPPNSPAAKLGVRPIDVSKAGLQSPYQERYLGRKLRTRITPGDQKFREPITVRIECNDSAATIRYTLDGSEPTRAATLYRGPFLLEQAATVRARAFAPDADDSVGSIVFYEPAPAPIVEGFETVAVGAVTPRATTSQDATLTQYQARVTNEEAFQGDYCLKFTDGPGQKASYTPHIYYRRTYDEGRMVSRVALRVDAATSMNVQWRQYDGNGYINGPTISIEPGGRVVYQDKQLMTIPLDRWVRFELSALLGGAADGEFDIRVWLPSQAEPAVFARLECDKAFTRLDWVGFVSKATRNATFYVDDIEIERAE